jgi:hypothetical protein
MGATVKAPRISSTRLSPDNEAVLVELGLLRELAGNWQGRGFNLIARPDREGNGALFLELNQTYEILKFDPISSPIPNRGSVQDDIVLHGLTYLQQISDSVTGGALHIEPSQQLPRRRNSRRSGTKSSLEWRRSHTAMHCWRRAPQFRYHP